jgi:hypothetical protein
MVATFDRVLLCWFRNGQASSRKSDENRWQRKPQSLWQHVQQPSTSRGSSEQILLNHVGWEARKSPAVAGVFFLDFPFYRTNQDLGTLPKHILPIGTFLRLDNWNEFSFAATRIVAWNFHFAPSGFANKGAAIFDRQCHKPISE